MMNGKMINRQKELARNTAILTIGKICTQFVSFLLLPLYTALLAPEETGIIDVFNTYITLFTPIFNWQLESGLFRFMIDCREKKEKQCILFSTILIGNIGQTIIYVLFFLVFQLFIHSKYKIFIALDVVANIFLNTMLQFPRGLGKNTIYSFGSFLSAASTVILNVILIAILRLGVNGMFVATLIAKLVTTLYLIIAVRAWDYFSYKAFDKRVFYEVLKYSAPLVPNQLSWWVIGSSDRTIISHYLGLAANGIYYVSNKFSTVFITFYNLFNLSWTESVSLHINDEDRDAFLSEVINTLFNFFSAIDIGIISCMPFIFHIMVNQQYSDAYYQIPILMIGVLFQVVVGLFSVIYVALKKSSEIAKTSFLAAIINISFDLFLIKRIGLYAASISTLTAFGAMAIYRYFDSAKYVKICLKRKSVVYSVIILVFTVYAYYSKKPLLNCFALILSIIYAVTINKDFIYSTLSLIKEKLQTKEHTN